METAQQGLAPEVAKLRDKLVESAKLYAFEYRNIPRDKAPKKNSPERLTLAFEEAKRIWGEAEE